MRTFSNVEWFVNILRHAPVYSAPAQRLWFSSQVWRITGNYLKECSESKWCFCSCEMTELWVILLPHSWLASVMLWNSKSLWEKWIESTSRNCTRQRWALFSRLKLLFSFVSLQSLVVPHFALGLGQYLNFPIYRNILRPNTIPILFSPILILLHIIAAAVLHCFTA